MIIDKVNNIMFYAPLVNHLKEGMEAVNALTCLEEGKYLFEGGFFMVQTGETKPLLEGTLPHMLFKISGLWRSFYRKA